VRWRFDVGRAITSALQRDRDADRLALLRGLAGLRNALRAFYWWGWDTPSVVIRREGGHVIREWSCGRSLRLAPGVDRTCRSVHAWRSPCLA
jgi:hypothetical protein